MPVRRNHYAHDLHGALYAGHARRGFEAAAKLLAAGRGLMDPMGTRNREERAELDMALGRAIDVLVETAEHEGMEPGEIIGRLEGEVEAWHRDFGGHRPLSDRRRDEIAGLIAGREGRREDPVVTGEVGWEDFDGFVDELVEETRRPAGRSYAIETLAHALKHEARLRRQAQDEAAELRAGS